MAKHRKMISKSAIDRLVSAIDKYIAKEDDDFKAQIEDEGYVATDAAVAAAAAIEDGMTDIITDYVDKIIGLVGDAEALETFISDTWPDIQTETDLKDKFYELLYEQFTSLFSTATKDFIDGFDDSLIPRDEIGDLRITKPAQEFLDTWTDDLSGIMQLSTNRDIDKVLRDSLADSKSVADTALAIGDSGIRSPGYKCRRVAQTEVLRVESYAELESMRQDPDAVEKEWMHTGAQKNKPRENHVAISGQRKPIDEPFELTGRDGGSYTPMCPRDTNLPASESVNCHCIMRRIRSEASMGMTVDERRALRKQKMDEIDAAWEKKQDAA